MQIYQDEIFDNFNNSTQDYPGVIFYKLYKEIPVSYRIYFNRDKEIKYLEGNKAFRDERKKLEFEVDYRAFIEGIDKTKSAKKISTTLYDYIIYGTEIPFVSIVYLNDDTNVSEDYMEFFVKEGDIEKVIDLLRDCFVPSNRDETYEFGIATFTGNSISTSYYDYDGYTVDVEKNYNDDFVPVYNKVKEIIEKKNETGLILFYGEPGTGKSTMIKNFITEYPDIDFVFVDGGLLNAAPQNILISYFVENQNTVFILEDCEKVLMSREETYNPVINTLLNITDGIIGDVLGIKLICTFNTELSKIDKALLRKGRLSAKYEFKKLKADKVSQILGREIKQDMTLADIYNIDEENDFSKVEKKKIGF